jgi:poly(hydroxyalkanoate) depolymerase family esterase
MNAFTKIDMSNALRLTRAGKLKEAVAMLRGGAAPAPVPVAAPAGQVPAGQVPAGQVPAGYVPAPHAPEMLRGLMDRITKFRLPGTHEHAPGDVRFTAHSFTNEAGTRAYKLYTPSTYRGQSLPLVIMLHGCTQSPDDFAIGTGMNELAEVEGFFVAYPAQPASANMQRCWNWFNTKDQQRDAGEPSLIAGITRQIMRDHAVKPGQVFVAGLSAGGAAAAIMGERYPDLYAAIGVHSGLACGAANSMASAFAAMQRGGAPLVAVAPAGGVIIPTIVFHGDQDKTVNVVNGAQVIAQSKAAATLTANTTQGETAGVRFTRTVQSNERGQPLLEEWILHGAGHAWSGGNPAGSFTSPSGPHASREMLRFFLQNARN